ncbi:hypothetical protein BHE74_00049555 [Ensete ventricosum]|nr:hypothetical protein BHE74_00049555 [Ensete ventricosum]
MHPDTGSRNSRLVTRNSTVAADSKARLVRRLRCHSLSPSSLGFRLPVVASSLASGKLG